MSAGPAGAVAWQPLQIGQVLQGKYRIVRPLGKGGMGAVYLIVHSIAGAEQKLVLKEMLDYWEADEADGPAKAQKRFIAEATTLVGLSHPGIPKIMDFFQEGIAGELRNFIVMEYVEGENLRMRLTREDDAQQIIPGAPYPQKDVIDWGIQLCKVLEYLSTLKDEQGNPRPVIHHDIKPANLILDKNTGEVRLIDFGTARADATRQPGSVGQVVSNIYGTAGYAPPEQYGNSPHTEPRSDVYALAATLYHLATDDPPDVTGKFPKMKTLAPALEQALRNALTANVLQRSHAFEFHRALEAIRTPTGVAAPFSFTTARGTTTVTDISSLVQACDQNWVQAKRHLYGRDFEMWLNRWQLDSLVTAAVEALRDHPQDQDKGLESFLGAAVKQGAPSNRRPRLEVQSSAGLDWGECSETKVTQTLAVKNAGKGYLFGDLKSSARWLKLSLTDFAGDGPHKIEVNADLKNLPLGVPQQATIALDGSGGQLTLQVRVTRVNAQVYLERGAAAYDSGQRDLALQYYLAALKHDPQDVERQQAAGAVAVLFSDLSRLPECFQWVIDNHVGSDWVDGQRLRWKNARNSIIQFCITWAGELYRRSNRQDNALVSAAIIWYGKAQSLGANVAQPLSQLHVDLALIYCNQAKFDESIREYEQAQAIAPGAANAYAGSSALAWRLVEYARDLTNRLEFSSAERLYRHAQAIAPPLAEDAGLAGIYFAWAVDAYRGGNLQLALEKCDSAIGLDGSNTTYWQERAWWHDAQNREALARRLTTLGVAGCGILTVGSAGAGWMLFAWTHLSLVVLLTAGVSGLCAAGLGLALVLQSDIRRLLDRSSGGVLFVAGLIVNLMTWLISAELLALAGGMVIARQAIESPGLRPIWLALWMGLTAFALATASEERREGRRLFTSVLGAGVAAGMSILVGGLWGLLSGTLFGGLLVGTDAFVLSQRRRPTQPQRQWKPLLTPARVGSVIALVLLTLAWFSWQVFVDRTVEKINAYEQARAFMAAKQIPEARGLLHEILALDPGFRPAASLLAMAREIDLDASIFTVDQPDAMTGSIRTYSVTISNSGVDAAPGVVVTNTVPSDLQLLTASLPVGVAHSHTAGVDILNWTGVVSPATSIQFSYQARVLPVPQTQSVITNSILVNNGLGEIVTRQATLRLVPAPTPTATSAPTPTGTPTRPPPPTRPPTSTPEPPKLTTASASWSGSQGAGGWFYVEGKPGDYANWQDMRWDPNTRYQNCDGGCWRSNSEADFVRLDRFGGHPGQAHYVGKRWVSESEGRIRVSISVYKAEAGGDGVTFRIVQNGSVIRGPIGLDGNQTQDRAVNITFDTPITVGGWIMMAVDSNRNTDYDHTVFDMTVWQLP